MDRREIRIAFGWSGWSKSRCQERLRVVRTERAAEGESSDEPTKATAKQGRSSDHSGGAGEARNVFGRSGRSETAEFRGPSGRRNRATRETWRRFSEQHGC